MALGDFIRESIKKGGFKQENIADKLQITPAGLSKMLAKDHLNTELIEKFSEILGFDVYLRYKDAELPIQKVNKDMNQSREVELLEREILALKETIAAQKERINELTGSALLEAKDELIEALRIQLNALKGNNNGSSKVG
jgi:transcriptional regulator with XRE-family HTH domain